MAKGRRDSLYIVIVGCGRHQTVQTLNLPHVQAALLGDETVAASSMSGHGAPRMGREPTGVRP